MGDRGADDLARAKRLAEVHEEREQVRRIHGRIGLSRPRRIRVLLRTVSNLGLNCADERRTQSISSPSSPYSSTARLQFSMNVPRFAELLIVLEKYLQPPQPPMESTTLVPRAARRALATTRRRTLVVPESRVSPRVAFGVVNAVKLGIREGEGG